MNNDLISKSALQTVFEKKCIGECGCCTYVKHYPEGCALIDDAPAVDAEPVRHARWVWADDGYLRCSECTQKAPTTTQYQDEPIQTATSYCPNCGAKMDGDECD